MKTISDGERELLEDLASRDGGSERVVIATSGERTARQDWELNTSA